MNSPGVTKRGQVVRQCQILSAALIMGVVIFMIIAVGLVQIGNFEGGDLGGIFIAVGGVFAMAMLVASTVLKNSIKAPANADEQTLLQVFSGRNLLQKAPLEGAAFLNILAYIVEQSIWSLGIATILLAAMLSTFPTRTRLDHFIESNTS